MTIIIKSYLNCESSWFLKKYILLHLSFTHFVLSRLEYEINEVLKLNLGEICHTLLGRKSDLNVHLRKQHSYQEVSKSKVKPICFMMRFISGRVQSKRSLPTGNQFMIIPLWVIFWLNSSYVLYFFYSVVKIRRFRIHQRLL